MVIYLCTCGWDIPGVTELAPHIHHRWADVEHDGRRFRMIAQDLNLNPGVVVLDQGEDLQFAVNWQQIARAWTAAAAVTD